MWSSSNENDRSGDRSTREPARPPSPKPSVGKQPQVDAQPQPQPQPLVDAQPQPPISTSTPLAPQPRIARTADQLRGGTLAELRQHTDVQADWANHLSGDSEGVAALWRWRDLAHDEALLLGSGRFKVADLIALETASPHAVTELRAYGHTMTQRPPTARLHEPAATVGDARALGAAMQKLGAALGHPLLAVIMPFPEQLLTLVEQNEVDALVKYYQGAQPLLHAHTGAEIKSFLAMQAEAAPWETYMASLRGRVRNFHRFENAALAALKTHVEDVNKTKPLAMVLQTAVDHSGAFHRNANLTQVLTRASHRTLLVEGATTLSELGSFAEHDAKQYGPNGKIDQLLIGGHGESDAMELAGTAQVAPGTDNNNSQPTLQTTAVELKVGDPESQQLIRRLLAVMSPSTKDHRIVLDACLTASKQVPISAIDKGLTYKEEREQVIAFGKNNPSLAEWIEKLVQQRGNPLTKMFAKLSSNSAREPAPEVVGARGKMFAGRTGFVNDDGSLGLHATDDPNLTANERDYLSTGKDPCGVMIALVRQWAVDPDGALLRIANRLTSAPSSDFEFIIAPHLEVAAQYWNNGQVIASLSGSASALFTALGPNRCSPSLLLNVPKLYFEKVTVEMMKRFPSLASADRAHYLAAVAQMRLYLDLDGETALAAVLGDPDLVPTCATIERYLVTSFIQPQLDALLRKNQRAGLILALIAARRGIATDTVRKLLRELACPTPDAVTPAATALIVGYCSASTILAAVYGHATAALPANADPAGAGTNTMRIQPAAGTAVARIDTQLHIAPGGDTAQSLAANAQLPVVGAVEQPAGWHAVRQGDRVVYARTADLEIR